MPLPPVLRGLAFFVILLVSSIAQGQSINPSVDQQKTKEQADALEDKSAQTIDDGNMSQGLGLMAQAVKLDPSPLRHMIYGSMLYGDGVEVFKNTDQIRGTEILHQSESELIKAIQGFSPNTDQSYLSQCYFLLGEMYRNAFSDKPRARGYYEQAIQLNDYPGAKEALGQISS